MPGRWANTVIIQRNFAQLLTWWLTLSSFPRRSFLALLFQFVGKPALEAAIRQWKHEYIRQNNRCSGWLVQGQQILFCPHLVGCDISSILANGPLFRGRQMLSWYLSMVLARTCNRSSESKERQQKPSILTLHLRNVFKKGSQASLPQIVRNGFHVITFSFFLLFFIFILGCISSVDTRTLI